MKDVEDFAAEHDLHDIVPDLKKGALVAQNPGGFDEMEEISPEEKEALRFEVTNKWRHPGKLYMTIIVCSIGAAVQYSLNLLILWCTTDHFTEDGIRLAPTAPTCPSLPSLASPLVRTFHRTSVNTTNGSLVSLTQDHILVRLSLAVGSRTPSTHILDVVVPFLFLLSSAC